MVFEDLSIGTKFIIKGSNGESVYEKVSNNKASYVPKVYSCGEEVFAYFENYREVVIF